MALESFANAHATFLEAIESMDRLYFDQAAAFTSQLEEFKSSVDLENGNTRFNAIAQVRSYRAGEVGVHANAVAESLKAVCDATGVSIPYDDLGFVDSLTELSKYNDAVDPYSDSGLDHKYPARGITRGSITAPSNTNIWFCDTTEDGYKLEGGFPQTVRFEVLTPPGQNQLSVGVNTRRATPAGGDWLQQYVESLGAPTPVTLPGYDRYRTGGIPFSNPFLSSSETTNNGTIGTSEISSWTVGTADKWLLDTGNTLRSLNTITCVASGNAAGDFDLEQNIQRVDPNIPYLPVMVIENTSSSSGTTIQMEWGDQSFTKTSSNMTGLGTWDFFTPDLTDTTVSKKLWPKVWANSSTPKVKFSVTTLGTGEFNLGGLLLIPGVYHAGTDSYYFCAGDDLIAEVGAVGTQSITVTDTSRIQRVVNAVGWVLEGRPGRLNATVGTTLRSDPV